MPATGLTVAVTGPTGDLGIGIVDALQRSRSVSRIIGMARRPFDPADRGWKKAEYRQGDVTDRESVLDLVKGADVVVHLAFVIVRAGEASRNLNVEGSRLVFEEAAKAGAERIVYASSVAAYGFHEDNPDWLTEDVPARGSPEFPYSQQKAEVEQVLADVLRRRRRTVAYLFRPCIVAGPGARTMLHEMPYFRLGEAMPDAAKRLLQMMPVLKPVIPDPGGADGARGGVLYNLAGSGTLTLGDLADALDWYSLPVPKPITETTAEMVTRLPLLPDSVAWIHAVRKPVLMKTEHARKELGWRPKHTSIAVLQAMVEAERAEATYR